MRMSAGYFRKIRGSGGMGVGHSGFFVGTTWLGKIFLSTDGLNWTEKTSPAVHHIEHFAVANNYILGVGIVSTSVAQLITSTDYGETWTKYDSPGGDASLYGADSDGTRTVAAGLFSLDTYIISTDDGINFTERAGSSGQNAFDVSYVNGIWMIFGDTHYRSTNGATFTPMTTPFTTNTIRGAAWNGSVYCAVGGFTDTADSHIWTSTDGDNWTQRSSGTGLNLNLVGIIWDGSKFVAMGSHDSTTASVYTLTSPDGITWTHITGAPAGTEHGVDFAYDPNNDRYVLFTTTQFWTCVGLTGWQQGTNPAATPNAKAISYVPPNMGGM